MVRGPSTPSGRRSVSGDPLNDQLVQSKAHEEHSCRAKRLDRGCPQQLLQEHTARLHQLHGSICAPDDRVNTDNLAECLRGMLTSRPWQPSRRPPPSKSTSTSQPWPVRGCHSAALTTLPSSALACRRLREILVLEKQVREHLRVGSPLDEDLQRLRHALEERTQRLIEADVAYVVERDVEQGLWKLIHYKVVEEHRKQLRRVLSLPRQSGDWLSAVG